MRRGLLATLALLASVLTLGVAGCGGEEAAEEPAQQGQAAEGEAQPAQTGPIRLSFSTWVGYGPLWIADEQGFFEEEGLDVQITIIEDPVQRFNAVKAKKLEAIASTIDTFARTVAKGVPTVQILALDASRGGDGIVASKEITSVEDLKGQKVAVSEGSVSEFFLAYVLQQHGMSLDDVQKVNMTSGDAGAAFAAGRVPVAVTWEPWLSKAEENPNGQILVSSEEYPDIIVDTLAFRKDFLEENPEAAAAFLRAYDKAVQFMETNADESNAILAEHMGMKPDEVAGILGDVKILTIEENQEFFGETDRLGRVAEVFGAASEFWQSTGEIEAPADPTTAIDPTFLAEYKG